MAIYTRRGDAGETGLGDGSRVSKASARVEAYGALDEVGALLGVARLTLDDPAVDAPLWFAQQRLANCAAALANPTPGDVGVSERDVEYLEESIDRLQQLSGPWRGFVLASGSEASARLHVARAVTRRAERRVIALTATESVDPTVLAFVNRLSDLLYAAASAVATASGQPEELWDRDAEPKRE